MVFSTHFPFLFRTHHILTSIVWSCSLISVNVSGWITKSDFDFHSVLVQPGDDVTLLCPNLTNVFKRIFWYKVIPGPNVSRISSMVHVGSEARLYDGFQREKFNMTSNGTNFFLNIKQVNFSDSGLYICGTKPQSCQKIFSETYLQVEGKNACIWANLMFLIYILVCRCADLNPRWSHFVNRWFRTVF